MGVLVNEMYGKFTQIPNIIIIDTKIKHTAFRQYCYLLSKPTGWKIRNTDISNNLGISEQTISSNFKNLINTGYLTRYPCKDQTGKFIGGYDYHIFVIPTEPIKITESENSISGKTIDYSNTKTIKQATFENLSDLDYLKMMYEVEEAKKKKPRSYDIKPREKPNVDTS